jgi:PBP1b-binding outer membrane lipoprotein LpoB
MRIKSIFLIMGLLLFIAGCATTETKVTEPEAPAAVEPAEPMEQMEVAPEPEPVIEDAPAVEEATREFERSQRKGM